MKHIRLVARLDVKGPNLVKGIHLEGLRALGHPQEFSKIYFEEGADELIYQDVVASLYERNSLNEMVSETAQNVFVPIVVGGGLRTIDDIQKVLRAGADKVSLNTAAVRNPKLILEAAKKFGNSTVVVAIEAIKQKDGGYLAFTDNGREQTTKEVYSWAKEVENMGAGEILLTSVDRDGTGEGFDLELISEVSSRVSIPVIAHGGAGSLEHILQVARDTDVSAVCLASTLHYSTIERHSMSSGSGEGNFSFRQSKQKFNKITPLSFQEIKSYLIKNNIGCRYEYEPA